MPAVSASSAVIGMYHIEKVIGHGGMGTVYLGRHVLLGRTAAIKVLLPSLSRNAEVVGRFFNEARALSRIADPGIVQIFDFGHLDDGRAFIVMEFLGESMHARLRRIRRFEVTACLRLSGLICNSMAGIHAQGIIHRDLKPENICIVSDASAPDGERPKIFDFGIAKQTGDTLGMLQTAAGTLMGTPMYMSPEQCRGGAPMDHRSDIYSIACVMFTMLTGLPPFGRRAPRDLVMAQLHEAAPLAASMVPDMPAVVDDILQRCLSKSPEDRFQSMTELALALGAAEQVVASVRSAAKLVLPAGTLPRPPIGPALAGGGVPPAATAGASAQEAEPVCRAGVAVSEDAPGGTRDLSSQRDSRRRRWLAGAVLAVSTLLGVLWAIATPEHRDRDGPAPRETSTAVATVRSISSPAQPTAATAPAAPPQPTVIAADAAPSPPGESGEIASVPRPPPPATTARQYPNRARDSSKHVSSHDTRGDHENIRPSAAPPPAAPPITEDQNVTRGD